MENHWDLIVIGGGAAGFFAAITCAEASGGRVLILEKTSKVLGKVKISGGGRCNVTHDCFDPKSLTGNYPRGQKSLIGPFHRWGVEDTVQWFENRGVTLKTEADGRMFPVTDSSQTVIDALTKAARDAGVEVRVSTAVNTIKSAEHFSLTTSKRETLTARTVLLATGGTRLAAGARLAESLGHELIANVPSLFAFNIDNPRIMDLPGVSVPQTNVSVEGMKLSATGPLLITHHGLSGPVSCMRWVIISPSELTGYLNKQTTSWSLLWWKHASTGENGVCVGIHLFHHCRSDSGTGYAKRQILPRIHCGLSLVKNRPACSSGN